MRIVTRPRELIVVALAVLTAHCSDPEKDRPPPDDWFPPDYSSASGTGGGAAATTGTTGPGGSGGCEAGSGGCGGAGGGSGGGAAEAPADNVILQGFYWDVPSNEVGGWWNHLAEQAPDFARAGIGAIWIPPPSKGKSGAFDVGYGIFDRYDLGEFDQQGTIPTRYGTLAELTGMIGAMHGAGIRVYADVVLNHMMGGHSEKFEVDGKSYEAPTNFDHSARSGKYSSFVWDHRRFNGCKTGGGWVQWSNWDFEPYNDGDAWDNLLGCEIRYSDADTRAETIAWGQWLTATLELDGYRLDATKHVLTSFFNEWLDAVKGDRFAVSEAWMGNADDLEAYAQSTGGRTRLFDVPLHYQFFHMSEGNGGWDMRGLREAGFTARNGDLSVTFVDNHDTVVEGAGLSSPVKNFKRLAYAYILLREKGVPTVFYKDYVEDGHREAIDQLLAIRRAHAFGPGKEHDESDADVYVYSRAGDATHAGLLLLLNDGGDTIRDIVTPFPNAKLVDANGNSPDAITTDAMGKATLPVLGRSYGVWVPQ